MGANFTMANGFKEKRISNWQALCEDFETYPTKPAWVFRGQRCESWGLKAGIERQRCLFNVKREDLPEYEWKIVREFRRRAHIYISNPPDDDDTVEWLALLQHHGGPTRLLDFTYSPFVATFFALEEADGDAAVWAIDIDWFHGRAAELVGLKKGGRIFHRFHSARDGDSFRKVFWLPPRCRFVAGVQPMRLNQRLAAQQGTFLCQGDITVSFDENVQFAGTRARR